MATGNIYAQTLLANSKKVKADRQANKEVFTDVGRNVMTEVELTNFGPVLVERYQKEKDLRQANKEVFTPDISRNVFELKNDMKGFSIYAKHLNDCQQNQTVFQIGNKGAHTGDISRTLFEKSTADTATYAKHLNEKQKAINIHQQGNKGAHNGDISRTVFERGPAAQHNSQIYAKALIHSHHAKNQQMLSKGGRTNDNFTHIY